MLCCVFKVTKILALTAINIITSPKPISSAVNYDKMLTGYMKMTLVTTISWSGLRWTRKLSRRYCVWGRNTFGMGHQSIAEHHAHTHSHTHLLRCCLEVGGNLCEHGEYTLQMGGKSTVKLYWVETLSIKSMEAKIYWCESLRELKIVKQVFQIVYLYICD